MSTISEQILARRSKYAEVQKVADSFGRMIGVRRLKPSQQLRVQEFAPGLEGTTSVVDETTGKTIEVPKTSPLIIAASVCEIDDIPVPFPKNRAELDATLDMLDDEGMKAVVEALTKLTVPPAADGQQQTEGDAAKN